MRKFYLVLLMIAAIQIAFAQNSTDFVRPKDLLKINTVENITRTKDSSRAAFKDTCIGSAKGTKQDYRYIMQINIIYTTAGEFSVL